MGDSASSYVLAELSFQRGDYERAYQIVRKRVRQGHRDIKTRILEAVALAMLDRFDEADQQLQSLRAGGKAALQLEKILFNRGLVQLYRDLERVGELSVASTSVAGVQVARAPLVQRPFHEAIETWKSLLKRKRHHEAQIRSYLSYALLQYGDLDEALYQIVLALKQSESHYVTNYVVGKIFLDLYHLSLEQSEFALDGHVTRFFGVEDVEILRKSDNRSVVIRDVLLEISIQAFLESREQNPKAPEVLIGLFHTFMLAGMFDESYRLFLDTEVLAPASIGVLDPCLGFFERVVQPPDPILELFPRVRLASKERRQAIAQYYLPPCFLL